MRRSWITGTIESRRNPGVKQLHHSITVAVSRTLYAKDDKSIPTYVIGEAHFRPFDIGRCGFRYSATCP